jgi:hypothetical protein
MHPDTLVAIAKQHLWELDREAERYRLARSGSRHIPARRVLPTLKGALYAWGRLLAGLSTRRAPEHRRQPTTTTIDVTITPDCVGVGAGGVGHDEDRA